MGMVIGLSPHPLNDWIRPHGLVLAGRHQGCEKLLGAVLDDAAELADRP